MIWLGIIIGVIIISFCGVLLFGAPYLPTLKPQIAVALELAGTRPNQTMLELGCGDGRVLLAAAKAGMNAVGYELNPMLAAIAWLRTRRYRRQVRVVWGDFWRAEWPPAEVIFTFLLPRYMTKLHKKILAYDHRPITLISFAFQIPGKHPDTEKSGLYRYRYK